MIYYIACTATRRLKIGYTKHEPEVRLKQLQTGSAADLRLIACHPGTPEMEKGLHGKFHAERLRGEWFEMSERLFAHISCIVWLTAHDCIEIGCEAPSWVKVGLRAMRDGAATPLPPEMAALAE